MRQEPKPGEFYRHFKKKLYQIIAIAQHSETGESVVVYQALYGTYGTYVRPLAMFMSEVDHVKYPEVKQKYRFERIELTEVVSNDSNVIEEGMGEIVKECNFDEADHGEINPILYAFLEADTYAEKLQVIQENKKKLDETLLHTMAISMDFSVPENGDIEELIEAIVYFIETHMRFEGSRLRN